MRKAIHFLEKEIRRLAVKYSNSFYAAYEFDVSTDTFFIEVLPEEKFNEVSLKEDLADVIFEFEKAFPDYSICFISNDRLVKLQHPTVIAEATLFDSLNILLESFLPKVNIHYAHTDSEETIVMSNEISYSGRGFDIDFEHDFEPTRKYLGPGSGSWIFGGKEETIRSGVGRKKKKEETRLKAA